MPKKKIKKKNTKKENIPHLIQHEDEEQIVSWWDADSNTWVDNPLQATAYASDASAEKGIEKIHSDGVKYVLMYTVATEPLLKKKREWSENPPIKYIEKKMKKKTKADIKIIPGMVLLDKAAGEEKPSIVTNVTDTGSVFSIHAEFPSYTTFDPLESLIERIEKGHVKIIWSPLDKNK